MLKDKGIEVTTKNKMVEAAKQVGKLAQVQTRSKKTAAKKSAQ